MRIPDNYDQFEEHERMISTDEVEYCAWCGESIGDTYFDIGGNLVCEECIDGCRRHM